MLSLLCLFTICLRFTWIVFVCFSLLTCGLLVLLGFWVGLCFACFELVGGLIVVRLDLLALGVVLNYY